MSSTTYIKEAELTSFEQRGKYTVGVVNCERIGVLHACLFANAGFKVICADANPVMVENISRGKVFFLKNEVEPIIRKHLNEGTIKVTNDLKIAVSQSEIVIVAVPASVNEKGKVDYSNFERALKQVGSNIRKGTLITIISMVKIGATETVLRETLEVVSGIKAGLDFFLAYSPILFPERQTLETLANYKRTVAALDKNSLEIASAVLGTITKAGVVKTDNIKAAEALTIFEAMHEYANKALANEFAFYCEKTGVDYLKVQSLAKANASTTISQPTISCENGSEAVYAFLEDAENLNLKLKVSEAATETNAEVLKHAVGSIRDALKSCGKTLRRAKILIMGASQTPNAIDIPKNSLKKLTEMLETKGAKINIYDPYLPSRTSMELKHASLKKSLTEAVESVDCIVILTGHDQFKRLNLRKMKLIAKMPAAIVDFECAIDPNKAEAEGFLYRGLGRGVWTK